MIRHKRLARTLGMRTPRRRDLTVESGQSLLALLDENPERSWEVLVPAGSFDDLRDLRMRGSYMGSPS